MAVGTVSFALDTPDAAVNPQARAADTQDAAAGDETAAPGALETMGGVLPPPRVPYAPDPGTYTQLWMAQTSTMTREETTEELSAYLDAYTGTAPDYPSIQATILSSGDWYGFLTVLPDNQVCLVHSLGKHSSGLGRPTLANNRVFGLLGEKVEDQLPPLIMAPAVGLTPWIRVQELNQPTLEQLQGLASGTRKTVLQPVDDEDDEEGSKVSVQNLCYVPQAWAAHFLAPTSPWKAL
jgi:hypothetical protein